MSFPVPPVLPGGPPYRSGEDPARERRLAELNAVGLLLNLGNGLAAWGLPALILVVLAGVYLGLRVLRDHRRRRAADARSTPPLPPGRAE